MEIELLRMASQLDIVRALQLVVIVLVTANTCLIYLFIRSQRRFISLQEEKEENLRAITQLFGDLSITLQRLNDDINTMYEKVDRVHNTLQSVQKIMGENNGYFTE